MNKLLLYLLILLIFFTSNIFAKTLRVVCIIYPPYNYQDPTTKKVKGTSVTLVKVIFDKMQQPVTFEIFASMKEILNEAKSGKADAILAYKTPNRERFLNYPDEELTVYKTTVFVTSGSSIIFNGSLTSLNPRKIGIVELNAHSNGYVVDTALQQKKLTNVIGFSSYEQAIQALTEGKIDIFIGNKYVTHSVINSLNLKRKIKQLHPDVQDVPVYIAFSQRNDLKSVIKKFDATVSSMKKDGSFQKALVEIGEQYAQELN